MLNSKIKLDDVVTNIELLDNVEQTFLDDKSTQVYKVRDKSGDKIFALIACDMKPIQLSVRCDQQLAKKLLQLYESVLPATNLNKNRWITILLTGQLEIEEIKSLIRLSYDLALQS